jgi:hypothetical protein
MTRWFWPARPGARSSGLFTPTESTASRMIASPGRVGHPGLQPLPLSRRRPGNTPANGWAVDTATCDGTYMDPAVRTLEPTLQSVGFRLQSRGASDKRPAQSDDGRKETRCPGPRTPPVAYQSSSQWHRLGRRPVHGRGVSQVGSTSCVIPASKLILAAPEARQRGRSYGCRRSRPGLRIGQNHAGAWVRPNAVAAIVFDGAATGRLRARVVPPTSGSSPSVHR